MAGASEKNVSPFYFVCIDGTKSHFDSANNLRKHSGTHFRLNVSNNVQMYSVSENPQASSNEIRSLGSVFISYSRKDYYFAESLTFALIQRDVAAWLDVKDLQPGVDWEQRLESAIDSASHLVLVASPDSLRSSNVAVEWKRALARGIPVIVAHRRGSKFPQELAAIPRVNFRGRFKPAVNSLVDHLKGQAENTPAKHRLWPLPPIVGITASLLLLMVGLTMVLADWGEIGSGAAVGRPLTIFELAILFGAVGLFIWHTSIAYLRRRMGMTRLAVILGYFVFAYGYPVLQHFKAPDVPAIFPATTMQVMGTVWPIAIAFSLTSVLWLCVLTFFRPADLHRWSPTGKAWNTYRTKLLVTSEHEGLNSLGTVGRFHILNDPIDEPLAQRIQEELTARGGQKVDAAKESTRIVLVLSNRTHLAWLDALETELRDKDLITVVVTAIGLSPTLSWLWKRQWIDFRRCASADEQAAVGLAGTRGVGSSTSTAAACSCPSSAVLHGRSWIGGCQYCRGCPTERPGYPGHVNRHIHRFVSVACMEICRAPRFAASFQHLADRCMECSDAFMRCAVYSLF